MTLSLYDASIPVFKQMLGGLDDVLGKAQAHAAAKKIEPATLTSLIAKLTPQESAALTTIRQPSYSGTQRSRQFTLRGGFGSFVL
jgi:hypothetical protein